MGRTLQWWFGVFLVGSSCIHIVVGAGGEETELMGQVSGGYGVVIVGESGVLFSTATAHFSSVFSQPNVSISATLSSCWGGGVHFLATILIFPTRMAMFGLQPARLLKDCLG